MQLETDKYRIDSVGEADLLRALRGLDGVKDTRAVLSHADEHYLQTAVFDNGFVVEKREGSEEAHFHAVPRRSPLPAKREPERSWFQRLFKTSDHLSSECAFTKEEMVEIFTAYFAGREPVTPLTWSPGYCDR